MHVYIIYNSAAPQQYIIIINGFEITHVVNKISHFDKEEKKKMPHLLISPDGEDRTSWKNKYIWCPTPKCIIFIHGKLLKINKNNYLTKSWEIQLPTNNNNDYNKECMSEQLQLSVCVSLY